MIRITDVAFVGYPVTDVARARRFYEGVLGLRASTAFDHGDRAWVEYDIGSTTIAITNISQEQWRPSSDGPSIALEVENFDEAVAALRGADVIFSVEPLENPSCRLAVFSDPDGNSIAIHRRNLLPA